MEDYVEAIGDPDYISDLMKMLFTRFSYPDTFFIVGFEGSEPVGFLWAEPKDNDFIVMEFYGPSNGNALFCACLIHARDLGFKKVRGLVKPDIAEAMARFVGADIRAYLLEVDL